MRNLIILIFLCVLVLACQVSKNIMTPIWLDYFEIQDNIHVYNITTGNITDSEELELYWSYVFGRDTNVIAYLVYQFLFASIFWGVILLVLFVLGHKPVGTREREFPLKYFVMAGISQSLSSVLVNYASYGTRTPPYLLAILANFTIPSQFIISFITLRKRPTLRKFLCALVVLLAEFVCIVPVIFPALESVGAHADDGGTSGIGAILWPICYLIGIVPHTIRNALIEKSLQEGRGPRIHDVNLVYYLLMFNAALCLFTTALFWADVIPGFGTSQSLGELAEKMKFNLLCLFGEADCSGFVSGFGWGNMTSVLISTATFGLLMRYSEGANFVVILLTLRTPLSFLFWTLFQVTPFQWNPHAHLSTWLSVGAIFVMVPAIYFYNTGAAEKKPERREDEHPVITETDEGPSQGS